MLVELADRLFKSLLACVEGGADVFGAAFVIKGQRAAGGFQLVEDDLTDAFYAAVARGVAAEVDLAVVVHFLDIAGELVAGFELVRGLLMVKESAIAFVDDCFEAEGRVAVDEHLYRVVGLIGWFFVREVVVQAGRGDYAIGIFVDVNGHDGTVAFSEVDVALLAVG